MKFKKIPSEEYGGQDEPAGEYLYDMSVAVEFGSNPELYDHVFKDVDNSKVVDLRYEPIEDPDAWRAGINFRVFAGDVLVGYSDRNSFGEDEHVEISVEDHHIGKGPRSLEAEGALEGEKMLMEILELVDRHGDSELKNYNVVEVMDFLNDLWALHPDGDKGCEYDEHLEMLARCSDEDCPDRSMIFSGYLIEEIRRLIKGLMLKTVADEENRSNALEMFEEYVARRYAVEELGKETDADDALREFIGKDLEKGQKEKGDRIIDAVRRHGGLYVQEKFFLDSGIDIDDVSYFLEGLWEAYKELKFEKMAKSDSEVIYRNTVRKIQHKDIRVGDWVSFSWEGILRFGTVVFLHNHDNRDPLYGVHTVVHTNCGSVLLEDIVEIRRG